MSKVGYSLTLLMVIILLIFPPLSTAPQGKDTVGLRPLTPERYKGMRNPLPRSAENILEGERLYDTLCSRCHGGNLDGNGPEAEGFIPHPADLVFLVTTARSPESYLFWRIREGWASLPKEFRWNSAMPIWKKELTDKEIWMVIMYIYESVGTTPP